MSERDVINNTKLPLTLKDLVEAFKALGLKSTDVCMVHVAMSKIGFIIGAERTIIEALQEVLCEGAIVMPAHSGELSDPAKWENPPVPEAWVEIIRNHMPAFDVHKTKTRGVGKVAELFRTFPNVYRSNHPQVSFCAWGVHAEYITENHPLTPMFGHESPLKKLYDLDAKIIMIGTDYHTVTALHYAEFLAQNRPIVNQMSYVLEDGVRKTVTFDDFDYDNEEFNQIGLLFESKNQVITGNIGDAKTKLVSLKKLVDEGFKYY